MAVVEDDGANDGGACLMDDGGEHYRGYRPPDAGAAVVEF